MQGTGRVGRALLVMYKVDTAKIGSEALQEVKERLLRRLESVGALGQHETVKNARAATVVGCPLLTVWSDLDRLDKLPTIAEPEHAAPTSTAQRPWPRQRWLVPAGLATLGVVVLAVGVKSLLLSQSERPIGQATGPPAEAQHAPAPARSADPAAAAPSPIKDEELRNELAAATNNSVDLLDPSRREAFATIWPGRLAKDNASSMRLLYAQYEKAYGKALDFTVDRATSTCQTSVDHAIKEAFTDDGRHTDAVELALRKVEQLFEDMKGLDGWLGKQQTNGPLLDTGLRGDFRKLMDDRRGALHEATYEFLAAQAKARPWPADETVTGSVE